MTYQTDRQIIEKMIIAASLTAIVAQMIKTYNTQSLELALAHELLTKSLGEQVSGLSRERINKLIRRSQRETTAVIGAIFEKYDLATVYLSFAYLITDLSENNYIVVGAESDFSQAWDIMSMIMSDVISNVLSGRRLVIFDTFNRIARAGNIDENSATEAGFLVDQFERVCDVYNTSVILIHHINKYGSDSDSENLSLSAIRGSSVIVDSARWALVLRGISEANAKSRFGTTDWEEKQKLWVKLTVIKQNHSEPVGAKWLYRVAGGTLTGSVALPVRMAKGSADTKEKTKEKIIPSRKKWRPVATD